MKKYLSIILAAAIALSLVISCASADLTAPYTEMDSNGYTNLPNPGSMENGNVLIDYELAKITVLRTRYMTEAPQYAIDLLVENKTDTPYSINSGDLSIVDGYAFSSYCYEEVMGNELKVVTLYILAEDFYVPAIYTPQEIKFNLAFMNDNFELMDIAYFAIYPSGINADRVSVTPMEDIAYSDLDYYDEGTRCAFRIIDARMQENGEFYQVDIILENKSGEYRIFSMNDVKVEGQECDPYWCVGMPADSYMVSHIYFDTLDLTLSDPNSVSSIDFTFQLDNYQMTLLQEIMSYTPAKG